MFAHSKRAESGDWVACYCPQDPYLVIYDFFCDSRIEDINASLNRLITTAFDNKKESNGHEVALNLYFFQDLLRLVVAAHTLYKKEALESLHPEAVTAAGFQQQVDSLSRKMGDGLQYPLFLSPVEWLCPRLVIKGLFSLHPLSFWELLLHRLLQSTTGCQPVLSVMPFRNTNLFEECLLLWKLVEAAWVIRVLELPEWED
jgi:hypothetical protein